MLTLYTGDWLAVEVPPYMTRHNISLSKSLVDNILDTVRKSILITIIKVNTCQINAQKVNFREKITVYVSE